MPHHQQDSAKECEKTAHDHFAEWCQMTGWHGVLDFYIANHAVWKITWLLVVLGGCFFAVNQTVNMVMDFQDDDQWITTTSYEMPKQGSLEWPNITICPLDWPDSLTYFDANAYYDMMVFNTNDEQSSTTSAMTATTTTMTPTTTTFATTEQLTTANGTYNMDYEVQSYYVPPRNMCLDIVPFCGYKPNDNQPFTHYQKSQCCESSTDTYSCFNVKPNATVGGESQNRNQGSRLFYALLSNAGADDFNNLDATSGFEIRVYLGKSDIMDDFSSTFVVQPGTRNVVSMIMEERRTVLKNRAIRLSKVNLPCDKPYNFLSTKEYSKDLCIFDCALSWEMKYCKCYSSLGMPDTILSEINRKIAVNCTNATVAMNCDMEFSDAYFQALNIETGYFSSTPEEKIRDAQCSTAQCPDPCTYRRVETKISTSLFLPPNKIGKSVEGLNRFLKWAGSEKNYTEDELRQLTSIEFFYESKQQRVVEKSPKITVEELISNIGGCLGVWSGISFLSIFQIVCYIWRAVTDHLAKRRAKKLAINGPKKDSPPSIKPMYLY